MARRVRGRSGAAVVMVVLAALLPACGSSGTSAASTVDAYLNAWKRHDYRAMTKLMAQPPPSFAAFQRQVLTDLHASADEHRAGAVHDDGDRASTTLTTHYTAPFGAWDTHGRLQLVKQAGKWKVQWSTQQIDTALAVDTHLSTSIDWPDRAPILGAGGAPLTVLAPMVRVGIQGSRVTDQAALANALTIAGATTAQIDAAVAQAKQHPDWFVPVVEMSDAQYQPIKPAIYPVPGTVFQTFSARQALTPGLDAHVVGHIGPITAEQLTQLGAPYDDTDTVGRSGIEAAYERQLAGTPGATVTVADSNGKTVATLASFPAQPGKAVQLSIDPATQRAAEQALAGVSGEATIVAVRASTGEILASASVPASRELDIGLRGQYPPGSTFKIVTTADLLAHGYTPSSPLTCPATITAGGSTFRNFEGEAVGALDLTTAFALSCNNAFIGAAKDLPADSFPSTAALFGIGTKPQIGVDAYGGSVPAPTGASEQAGTAIGQAKVTVSPLTMASVAAAVDAGSWHAPRLVAGAPNDSVAPQPLDPGVVSALQTMMAAVVSRGTAAGTGLPSGTFGKTGTAEFGPATPLQTHAWFVGYRGDVAFAVLVPGGGVGGAVAAPLAAKFLVGLG